MRMVEESKSLGLRRFDQQGDDAAPHAGPQGVCHPGAGAEADGLSPRARRVRRPRLPEQDALDLLVRAQRARTVAARQRRGPAQLHIIAAARAALLLELLGALLEERALPA